MSDIKVIEAPAVPSTRYLSIARLCEKLPRKKSWIYERIKNDPTFPRAVPLGHGRCWKEHEIDAWIMGQAQNAAPARRPPAKTATKK